MNALQEAKLFAERLASEARDSHELVDMLTVALEFIAHVRNDASAKANADFVQMLCEKRAKLSGETVEQEKEALSKRLGVPVKLMETKQEVDHSLNDLIHKDKNFSEIPF